MKRNTAIGLSVFIIIFVAAIFVLLSAIPVTLNSCGKNNVEKRYITEISFGVFTADGEQLYSCAGSDNVVNLKADTDYMVSVSAVSFHYGQANGMVGYGKLLLNYGDISLNIGTDGIMLTERIDENKRLEYTDEAGYFVLNYIMRGTKCSDKK